MTDVLQALVGQLVQIYSIRGDNETSDTGTLEAYDANWLCLNRNGDRLFFSVSCVRLIKLL
ncbi:MAG: hypothetical protein ACRYFS_26730 [Janthinobacterium lividum]